MKKRGISPLLATVLLLGFAILIIILIIIWGEGIVREQTEKREKLIDAEIKCNNVRISARENNDDILIDNIGNQEFNALILRGENSDESLVAQITGFTINAGDFYTIANSACPPGDNRCASKTSDDIRSVIAIGAGRVDVIPGIKPTGRGAPIIPCSKAKEKIKINEAR